MKLFQALYKTVVQKYFGKEFVLGFLLTFPDSIQKEHIVVQYNLALQDLPLFEQATLHPQLTIFRTLSGATAHSV